MTHDDVRAYLARKPFHPVMLYLVGGSSFEVRHPELAMLLAARLELAIAGQPEERIGERVVVISLDSISRLELEEPSRLTL
jgi:hypothetical protein